MCSWQRHIGEEAEIGEGATGPMRAGRGHRHEGVACTPLEALQDCL